MSMVSTKPPKTTIFRLFLENAKFKSRKNLDRKLNNFGPNNFSSSCTWYIQIFRAMARFRELSVSPRPCLLYIIDIYGVSSGYIQQYSRLNLGFFHPRSKNSLGRQAVPSGIFWPRMKKILVSGLYCWI